MKRKISIFVAAVLGVAALLSFSACNQITAPPDKSTPSKVAIQNGYSGTEASWLASLESASSQERQWYSEAKKDGYTGTFVDFLKDIESKEDTATVQRVLTSVVSVYASFPEGRETIFKKGAGVIYSLDKNKGEAYIVTNCHVIYRTKGNAVAEGNYIDDIWVYLYGNETFSEKPYTLKEQKGAGAIPVSVVGGSLDCDIAVLKVENSSLLKETEENEVFATAAVGGNSDSVTVGERVYALGNPRGAGISVLNGVVSVDYEKIKITAYDGTPQITLPEIRTDAAINEGNSGGGLFNTKGELIGIVNARGISKLLTGQDGTTISGLDIVEGFGYAIPANFALAVVDNIIDNNGELCCAYAGLTLKAKSGKAIYDPMTAKVYIEEKVIISDLDTTAIGYRTGLRVNDTILNATLTTNGWDIDVPITRTFKFENLLLRIRKGDVLTIEYSRSGKVNKFKLDFSQEADFELWK